MIYPNININEGISIAIDFFEDSKEELQSYYPTDVILDFIVLFLKNYNFHFRDTCWIKNKGT